MALCRLGADVVGLDACQPTIDVANIIGNKILKPQQLERLNFFADTIENFVENNAESFDGVIASEVVEHVSDLPNFIKCCVELAKPNSNSPLLFTTINKTLLSRVMANHTIEII